jgi:hypothetical protein
MMKRAIAATALLIASGSGVYAAEAPHCMSLAKAQKEAGKGTTVMALSPAQFHFMQGMYVALPTTPEGLPPGDGALILTRDKGEQGLILWTRGVLACDPTPIGHPAELMKILADVKAGAASEGDGL